jgi:uncharacterized protein YecE (DUF72 family)
MGTAGTRLFVGCAGWSIPQEHKGLFPAEGTHLERYAQVLPAVEINSSFYRPHRLTTYQRWAASVPAGFRFAVKVPREITHRRRLQNVDDLLSAFFAEVAGLGEKLGPLLVQLPPKYRFASDVVGAFFRSFREQFAGLVVCEPRHESWFTPSADQLLESFQVARVAADPAVVPSAAEPGGWQALSYYRLHGSPEMYYSAYSAGYLEGLARELKQHLRTGVPAWCIFDNTARGEATINSLCLWRDLAPNG